MIRCEVVVDLLFGDSGKGITTDFLCSRIPDYNTIVVRFSGGQQAGHNVVIDNVSHIHSSFGSGTLRGVPSYFTEHCTLSPINMWVEQQILNRKGITPELYIHPLAMVTTPADIAFNRLDEKIKGHGSCGMGIGATMERNLNSGYKLFAIDLLHKGLLEQKLEGIKKYYLSKLVDEDIESFRKIFQEQEQGFQIAINNLIFNIRQYDFIENYTHVVFEGSQGILLDKDHGIFPNVTYGNTTSKNAIDVCKKLGVRNIEIYYVTRCYQTRHGNGWMSNQTPIKLINTDHEINVFNEWQKDFKIGEIDYDLLNHSLKIDDIYSYGIEKKLVVTCLDQRPGFIFDYEKIKIPFIKYYESRSPDSKKGFTIIEPEEILYQTQL